MIIAVIKKLHIRATGKHCGEGGLRCPESNYDNSYCIYFKVNGEPTKLSFDSENGKPLRCRACLGCEARAKGLGWYNEKNIRYNHECKR